MLHFRFHWRRWCCCNMWFLCGSAVGMERIGHLDIVHCIQTPFIHPSIRALRALISWLCRVYHRSEQQRTNQPTNQKNKTKTNWNLSQSIQVWVGLCTEQWIRPYLRALSLECVCVCVDSFINYKYSAALTAVWFDSNKCKRAIVP